MILFVLCRNPDPPESSGVFFLFDHNKRTGAVRHRSPWEDGGYEGNTYRNIFAGVLTAGGDGGRLRRETAVSPFDNDNIIRVP